MVIVAIGGLPGLKFETGGTQALEMECNLAMLAKLE